MRPATLDIAVCTLSEKKTLVYAVTSHNTQSENCSVTRLGEDWLATSWPRRGSAYSDEFSWSTVEMIAQASDDIIKVVPKMKTRSSDLCP